MGSKPLQKGARYDALRAAQSTSSTKCSTATSTHRRGRRCRTRMPPARCPQNYAREAVAHAWLVEPWRTRSKCCLSREVQAKAAASAELTC
jgi:hypothetical protein